VACLVRHQIGLPPRTTARWGDLLGFIEPARPLAKPPAAGNEVIAEQVSGRNVAKVGGMEIPHRRTSSEPAKGLSKIFTTRSKNMKKLLISIFLSSTIATMAQAQDAGAGQTAFALCGVCHAVGEGAQNKLGPVLNDVRERSGFA
jgi:mono/diheme cytochrome c family protein